MNKAQRDAADAAYHKEKGRNLFGAVGEWLAQEAARRAAARVKGGGKR
jgi:hypothetical protein